MTYFFLRFFLFFLLLFLFLKKEFALRKKQGISPKNLKELFDRGSKWKKGSNPDESAFLFAVSSFIGFSIWESLILSALNLFPFLNVGILLGVIGCAILMRKRELFHEWTFEEANGAIVSMGLLTGALFCWLLYPWLYYRARYLKKNHS